MEKFGLSNENLDLRKRVAELEAQLAEFKAGKYTVAEPITTNGAQETHDNLFLEDPAHVKLDLEEFQRYGRQMILPEIGFQGQLQLKRTKVLIIGAGGLGCPASVYLAGAGLGTIGIIDGDTIETSNLHRQILHTTPRVGQSKVFSAIKSLKELNPYPKYVAHEYVLTSENALEVIDGYDVVFDCTDLPSTRYLISDACVLAGKPLVSASALRGDGQLVVLNNPPGEGPCYRCVFPRPPPAETVLSCGEGGILGPVVGVMGVLMATEGIKLIVEKAEFKPRRKPGFTSSVQSPVLNGGVKEEDDEKKRLAFTMTIYSAFSPTPFRTIRMLGRRKNCVACSADTTVTRESLTQGSLDYVAFCGGKSSAKYPTLLAEERVGVEEYNNLRKEGLGGVLVDVRDQTQFDICSLGGINVPITTILTLPRASLENGTQTLVAPLWLPRDVNTPIYFICRVGNDSSLAVERLKQSGFAEGRIVKDIRGGLWEWARKVDKDFPLY